jgi:hypothetical protein
VCVCVCVCNRVNSAFDGRGKMALGTWHLVFGEGEGERLTFIFKFILLNY